MKELIRLLFMPCDGISGLVSESMDRSLTPMQRFAVRLHLLYCAACRRYRRHLESLRRALRDDVPEPATVEARLPSDASQRLTDALRQAADDLD